MCLAKEEFNMEDMNTKEFMYLCLKEYLYLRNKKLSENDYHDFEKIEKSMIKFYLTIAKDYDFNVVIEKLKEKYITDESKIEKNESREEKEGIGIIYDYIRNYDFAKNKNFNIFVESLNIHCKLYSRMQGKEFGGKLRDGQALLLDTDIEVLPAEEAKKYFNSFIINSKDIMEKLDNLTVEEYILESLKIMCDLIKVQPFADGNKRTFRSLLNLMLKRRNLPPVYIGSDESFNFKKGLLKAIRENDFDELYKFYLKLICDSITLVGLKDQEMGKRKSLALSLDDC